MSKGSLHRDPHRSLSLDCQNLILNQITQSLPSTIEKVIQLCIQTTLCIQPTRRLKSLNKDKRIIDAIKDFVQKRGLKQRNISDEEINSDINKIRDSKVLNYNKYNEPTFHILENITKAKPIYASKAKLEDNSRNKP